MNALLKESGTGTQLLPLESIDAAVVFRDRERLDELLARVRDATASLIPDLTTEEGRKQIASTAYKVARSKTAIDEAGKNLVDEWKQKAKVVDAERKHARDTLDALRDEIRRPLDEWEAEEARKEQALVEEARLRREKEEADRLAEIERREQLVRESEARLAAREKEEADRIAAEQAERDRVAREEQIARDAAAKAERDAADAVARAAREVEEARERERLAAEKAESDRVAAEERAAREQAEAVRQAEERAAQKARDEQAERDRQAAAQRAEDERRAANVRHQTAVNRKALAALVENNVDEAEGKRILNLIASGKIPAVSITY